MKKQMMPRDSMNWKLDCKIVGMLYSWSWKRGVKKAKKRKS